MKEKSQWLSYRQFRSEYRDIHIFLHILQKLALNPKVFLPQFVNFLHGLQFTVVVYSLHGSE